MNWATVRAFFRGLHFAWVPFASVLLGFVMFALAPQAQDLFLEVRGDTRIAVLFWIGFYAAVLLVWALPVYVSARWILYRFRDSRALSQGDGAMSDWLCRIIPRVLAVGCLAAIFVGQLLALSNAPTLGAESWATEIASSLQEESSKAYGSCVGENSGIWRELVCAASNFEDLVQVGLYHASDNAGAENVVLIFYGILLGLIVIVLLLTWIYFTPRLPKWVWVALAAYLSYLAIFTGVAVLSANVTFGEPMDSIVRSVSEHAYSDFYLSIFGLLPIVIWYALPFVLRKIPYLWLRQSLVGLWWTAMALALSVVSLALAVAAYGYALNEFLRPVGLGHLAVLPIITAVLTLSVWWWLRPARHKGASRLGAVLLRQTRQDEASNADSLMATDLIWNPAFYALLVLTVVLLAFQVIPHPVVVTEHVYRALMVPFFLGLLVPAVTYISHFSFWVRAPIVLGGIVVFSLISAMRPDIYDVRTAKKAAERPNLEQTVQRWADVNNCVLNADAPNLIASPQCPQPIIMAAAGGASRAGFLVGGVVGSLIDAEGRDDARRHPFAKQLFAISGVSGGALGAAVVYGALADSQLKQHASNGIGQPPCKEGAHDTEYFAPDRRVAESWRSCLEQILAGDFLSPVFVGLISNDLFGAPIRHDRAAILENAWERRYAHLTGQRVDDPANRSTLERSLTELRNDVLNAAPNNWLPMLLLNGTSVTTGRRIIVSDVDTRYSEFSAAGNAPRRRLFRDAYDLHELLEPQRSNFDGVIPSPDGRSFFTRTADDGALQLWDMESGQVRWSVKPEKEESFEKRQFIDEGRQIIAASESGYMLIESGTGKVLRTGNFIEILRQNGAEIDEYPHVISVLRPDGGAILVSVAKELVLIDVATGRARAIRPFPDVTSRPVAAAFSADSKLLAAIWYEDPGQPEKFKHHVAVVDARTLETKRVVRNKGSTDAHGEITVSRDGRIVVIGAGGHTGSLVFVDMESGEAKQPSADTAFGEHEFFSNFAFSPDDKYLVATTASSSYLYDVEDKRFLKSFKPLELVRVNTKTYAIVLHGGRVRMAVFDNGQVQFERSFKGNEGLVQQAKLFADGTRLLTHDDNGAARIWDVRTGRELRVLRSIQTDASCETCDIRLSTAASSSARFPVISPHGNIRRSPEEDPVDRVVDGGYYENFGAITAFELADVLRSRYGLRPAVILVNNEPSVSGMNCILADSQIAYPDAPRSIAFSTVRSPLRAVLGTRGARGTHAAVELCSRIGTENFAFITVQPDRINNSKALSMSWWLSKHVQSYLDAQIDETGEQSNAEAFRKIDKWRRAN